MCHQTPKRLRPSKVAIALVLAGLAVGVGAASAQAQEGFLPNNVVTAQDATAFRSQIDAYVATEVNQLKSDDPNAQKSAKESLVKKVDPQLSQPSASFLNEYADSLNQALLPLAKDKSLRTRLNAAVVNASIAEQAGNARQVDSTLAFVDDSEEPIVLWGLKAAKFEIPALIQIPAGVRNDKLTAAILPAVKAHNASGPIIEEAYKTLTLDTTGNNFVNLTPQQLQDAATPVLDLFQYRISLYGSAAPEDPLAENLATLFLTRDKVWSAETAKQQRQTLDSMWSLCDAAAKLEIAGDPRKDDLISLIRQTGRAVNVMGTILNDKDLTADGDGIGRINQNTEGQDVEKLLRDLHDHLNNVQLNSSTVSNGGGNPNP